MNVTQTMPFWGAQTSYLNFCEEDYVVTRYVAEFINTLSSLTFVFYGLYGLSVSDIRRTEGAASRLISYLGLVGVGVCSAGYHMTLKYHTQMSDELSMHLLTTPLLYRILTFDAPPQQAKTTGMVLTILFTVVMGAHMVLDEFLLHATTFALGIYMIAARSQTVIYRTVENAAVRKRLQMVSLFGAVVFVFGYLLWLVDDWACGYLTRTRHSVGLPWAFLFEFHGWWHVFTATGGYIGVAVVDLITSGEISEDAIETMLWPVPFASALMSIVGPKVKTA